jgi:hypothetical protein
MVSNLASAILKAWKLHMRAHRAHLSTSFRRYDLAVCSNCMNTVMVKRSDKRPPVVTASSITNLTSTPGGATQQTNTNEVSCCSTSIAKGWLSEQVTVFSRGRLEGWRDATTGDEFNSYSSFKYRLVLSELHLEVSDPRGRFVKTITFYYSPRPVAEVAELKSPDYIEKWQPCGTIALAKGASRGSCKLLRPVVAANIRIEYASFYERPGSSKSSDGSFIIHCPRCTYRFGVRCPLFVEAPFLLPFFLLTPGSRFTSCHQRSRSVRQLRRGLLSMPKG